MVVGCWVMWLLACVLGKVGLGWRCLDEEEEGKRRRGKKKKGAP